MDQEGKELHEGECHPGAQSIELVNLFDPE
jgi:hypothetical protein